MLSIQCNCTTMSYSTTWNNRKINKCIQTYKTIANVYGQNIYHSHSKLYSQCLRHQYLEMQHGNPQQMGELKYMTLHCTTTCTRTTGNTPPVLDCVSVWKHCQLANTSWLTSSRAVKLN